MITGSRIVDVVAETDLRSVVMVYCCGGGSWVTNVVGTETDCRWALPLVNLAMARVA